MFKVVIDLIGLISTLSITVFYLLPLFFISFFFFFFVFYSLFLSCTLFLPLVVLTEISI